MHLLQQPPRMQKKYSRLLPLVLLVLPRLAAAQETLTLENALRLAMEGNHTVRLAENQEALARTNRTIGNAGFLPSVDVTAGLSGSVNNARQLYTNGDIINRSAAGSTTASSGIGLNWTVFDGFRMFNRYDELKERETLGSATVRLTRELTSQDVAEAYYQVVQQQQVLKVLRATVSISEARVENAQLRYDVGENSKREVLQARVDLNADRSAVLRQEVALATIKTTLNQLLGRSPETDFRVVDTIIVRADLELETLRAEALANNSTIQVARINRNLADYALHDVGADRYPRVGLNLGYSFSHAETETGLISSNRNAGLTYGLNASMNLFNGLNTNRQAENARILIQSTEIEMAQVEERVKADLLRAHTNYRNRMALVDLERENLVIARENLDIALDRSRLGAIIPLELREAQNGYVAAEGRLVTAQYEAKLAEIELLRLVGREPR